MLPEVFEFLRLLAWGTKYVFFLTSICTNLDMRHFSYLGVVCRKQFYNSPAILTSRYSYIEPDIQEAKAVYEKALELDPTNAEARQGLQHCAQSLRNLKPEDRSVVL